MSTKNNRYYWTKGTRIIEPNESNTQGVNRYFPNLIPTETLVLCLYLSKFENSFVPTPKKVSLQHLKLIFPVILWIFNLKWHDQASLNVPFVRFCLFFIKFKKLKTLYWENKNLHLKSLPTTWGLELFLKQYS